jgi:hypothetical protein
MSQTQVFSINLDSPYMPKLFSFTNLLYFWFYTFSKIYCTAAVLPVQSSECWDRHLASLPGGLGLRACTGEGVEV